MGERGVDQGGFFIIQFFGEPGFGALAGLFGFRFINGFGANGHIGHDGDTFARNLDKALAHSQEVIVAIFAHDNFAGHDLGHERHVLREDAHFAFDGRKGDHLDIFGVGFCLWSDDFQFKGGGHGREYSKMR